jgi:glucokinase
MLLAGDIGGTKTDLALFSAEAGPRVPLAQAEFPSASYPSLAAIVREFLAQVTLPVESACFDIAGPVLAGRAKLTNLTWVVDAKALKDELHLESVWLLNDLEATARAVPVLEPGDLHTLNTGEPMAGGAVAVIAPGSGLGEAFLTRDGVRYFAHPSEGGHADFAPADGVQTGLLEYVRQRQSGDHVSVERVCSGLGLPTIYDYLRDTGYAPETPEVAARLAAAGDRTPVIVEAALHPDGLCSLCAATLEIFVEVLAAEAGNLALKVLATGGVYLGGGIPRRIMPVLENPRFLETFQRKGRLRDVLARVPIHVILRQVALIGAASYGLEQASGGTGRRKAAKVAK